MVARPVSSLREIRSVVGVLSDSQSQVAVKIPRVTIHDTQQARSPELESIVTCSVVLEYGDDWTRTRRPRQPHRAFVGAENEFGTRKKINGLFFGT